MGACDDSPLLSELSDALAVRQGANIVNIASVEVVNNRFIFTALFLLS
jgi:hypothetical protein